MAEARHDRDVVADGVSVGYGEAQVSAGVWKRRGGVRTRPWASESARPGLTGEALEKAVDMLALRFPGHVETIN